VDQTDGRSILRVSGPCVRDVLRKGVTLDLHPREFGVGSTALTLVGGIDVHLWQIDERPTYDIVFYRSMTGSFWNWLVAAAAEYGLDVFPRSKTQTT
jgi:sarcosine oxidase subunit gamma